MRGGGGGVVVVVVGGGGWWVVVVNKTSNLGFEIEFQKGLGGCLGPGLARA